MSYLSNTLPLSKTEKLIGGQLASLMKGIRLSNPYNRNSSLQRILWEEQSQINLPFLILAALELPEENLAFVHRDRCHLQPLHEALTGIRNTAFHASRNAYRLRGRKFKAYCKETVIGKTIVELCASGRSSTNYFRQTFNKTPKLIILIEGRETIRHPNIITLTDRRIVSDHCDFYPFIEYFNCSYLGTVTKWPNRKECEIPINLLKAQHGAIAESIKMLPLFPEIQPDSAALNQLITFMPNSQTVKIIPHVLNHKLSLRSRIIGRILRFAPSNLPNRRLR